MSTAKPSARFLPTLTEVVQVLPAQAHPPKAGASSADSVQELTQRAFALLEARMAQRMEALVKVQAQNVLEGLRDQMQLAISDAVKQALHEGE
jgi:hypothetical protein